MEAFLCLIHVAELEKRFVAKRIVYKCSHSGCAQQVLGSKVEWVVVEGGVDEDGEVVTRLECCDHKSAEELKVAACARTRRTPVSRELRMFSHGCGADSTALLAATAAESRHGAPAARFWREREWPTLVEIKEATAHIPDVTRVDQLVRCATRARGASGAAREFTRGVSGENLPYRRCSLRKRRWETASWGAEDVTMGAALSQLSLPAFHEFYEEFGNPFTRKEVKLARVLVGDVLRAHDVVLGDERLVPLVKVSFCLAMQQPNQSVASLGIRLPAIVRPLYLCRRP